jgi:mRNA interferase RelE/StbE
MRYSLEFTTSALREYRSLERQMQRRIAEQIAELCIHPLPTSTKKLQAEPNHYRIRVGDYRIIYRLDGTRLVVVIVRIGHRRDVYR